MQARVGIVTLFVVGSLCVPGSVFAQGSIRSSVSLVPVDTARISSGPARSQNPPATATQAPSSSDQNTTNA